MGEKRMENFALEQVRPEDRKGWISLAFVQMGMIICVPSLLLGAFSLWECSCGRRSHPEPQGIS